MGKRILDIPAVLALEDGSLFYGKNIGVPGQAIGEVVFNTAIFGYQEIITDPSYAQQLITLTHPHIGNVGVNAHDAQSKKVWAKGLIVRELSHNCQHWRAEQSLQSFLQAQQVVGISEIDTRALVHRLRDKGVQNGCIMAGHSVDEEYAVSLARKAPSMVGRDLAKVVSTEQTYQWTEPTLHNKNPGQSKTQHVVAIDFGVKKRLLALFIDSGCRVTVVPATTSSKDILALKPDGVFLSNGPGDPEPCRYAIETIKALLQVGMPLFGICLGCQLLALACGAETFKMKFGHHGGNHPVKDLATSHVLITSQNHGFAVDEKTLPDVLKVTHRSLFDNTVQGITHTKKPALGFQGHPEAAPGPRDAEYLFGRFIDLMVKHNINNNASQAGIVDAKAY